MGGRKGYALKRVIGDVRTFKKEKKELLEWIDEKNPQEVVRATGKLIAKSEKLLDSITTSLKFVDLIEPEERQLKEESTKERRKDISKKWAEFRKKEGKRFDSVLNRKVVDSINRALGDKE